MSFASSSRTDRVRAGIAAVIVQGVLGYALITGLVVRFPESVPDALKLFAVKPPLPPPSPKKEPVSPPRETVSRPQGAASPPNLRATATPIVVPPPVVLIPVPPLVIVAEKANTGAASISGASTIIGPGTGSGGQGDGSGSGGAGDGDGSGGGAPLRQIAGRITGNDYPRRPFEAGIGGTLFVRYIVGVRGRVTDCTVTRSSGNAELDAATCRLITERFRFKPRRNAAGRPVPAVIVEDHSWVVDR
ncbi:energy transducer TonB [Sphingomonas sp. 28-62-11]|uniref:energy transducer TonB n=1 Tax=Sphingomonas sp. 28-62-11 TaxID=1970432 RepID=UPI000BD02678|nr:MAG: hypothetical protein B7Y49_05690 [Sphingomonas sp. 28-62-11]